MVTLESCAYYKVRRSICIFPVLNGKSLSCYICYDHGRYQSKHMVLRLFVGVAFSQVSMSYNVFSTPTTAGLSYAMTLIVPNLLVGRATIFSLTELTKSINLGLSLASIAFASR